MIGGLLSGIDEWLVPKSAPEGAPYDADTLRMARATLLANLGATLLSAGQGGQSYDQRAQTLGNIGKGVESYNAVIAGDADKKLKQLQLQSGKQGVEKGALEMEAMKRAMAREEAWKQFLQQGLVPSATTQVAAGAAGIPTSAPPANPSPAVGGATPPTESPAATPVPPPSSQAGTGGAPVATPAATRTATQGVWAQLGVSPERAQQIMLHPNRDEIIKQLVVDRSKADFPKEMWEPVPPGESPVRKQLGISSTQPAIVQRDPKGQIVDFKLLGEDPDKPPANYRWSPPGANGERVAEPIPGGPASQVPAENAARVGVATTFLERAPQLQSAISAGVFEGATNRALLAANKGEPAYYYRLFQDGQDALIRALTGAGMPDVEAVRYAQRFLPNTLSSKEEVQGKYDSLVYALRNVQEVVSRGRGGPPAATGAPPQSPYGDPARNAQPPAAQGVRRYNPATGRIE